ncbi:NIPSNAP family containing protein [Chryseobacterium lactis]|uniref:NIPSNAP family containing protein n=1 Tax=Chryseobacterium lactis TaxID=1241981 RepID=A0A3G6RG83_CHRLC|nr:NIPSNAP family protein [Chryseobacterium lactis]AZA83411.1 NIPSNAP family containing protein [Chryseobacterium lactis]AZB03795.1 NIPSNAP family containing protein [Chryseobacterium lactis]PNW11628.1 NIPSNAP family containing protein [Chryseobacterium lactis]
MKKLFIIFLIILSGITLGQTISSKDSSSGKPPIHQLRIYEIPKENRQVFLDRFRDHALKIMKKYGFTIVSIWESEYKDKAEFVYLLEWKNEVSMKKAWEGFMSDQEWKDIKAQTAKLHGNFVNNIEDRTLKLTEFSPQKQLVK